MSYAVAQATVVITEPELVLRSNPLGFHDPDYLTTWQQLVSQTPFAFGFPGLWIMEIIPSFH